VDWTRYVFERLQPAIFERHIDLAGHLPVDVIGHADAAGLRNTFQPRGYVDAISKDVIGLDDYIADVNTDTEENAPVFRIAESKFMNASLKLNAGADRFDRARKLRQESVAGILDDAPAMLRNGGPNRVRQQGCQFGVRGLFVIVHEPAIAGDIRR
jgi:hypothetical protein